LKRVLMQNYFEKLFKTSYLLFVLISFNVFFARHWYIPHLSYVIVALGVVVGIMRLLHVRDYLNVGVFLLLSFVCSYALGAVNSFDYGYIDNVKAVVWMLIQYFLIFAFDKNADYSKERDIIFAVILVYTCVSAIISITMMLMRWQYYSLVDGMYWVLGGFVDNRLWGVYTDPNYGAILSIVSIVISLFYLTGDGSKDKRIKAVLVINIVLEYLYLCYADSRTGLLAVVAAVVIACVLWVSKSKGFARSIALAIVLSTILVVGSYGIRNLTSAARVEIAKISATRAGMSQEEIAMEMDLARVGRVDEQIGGGTDVTNNRIAIWGNAIEIFKQHPIVGISYRNIREYAYDKIPDTYAEFESMHNFFFDILVSQGIIGVAILFMLMGWVIWTLIKKYKDLTDYREFAFMMAIIAAIFASMLTYSETFYMNTGGAFIFWYVLGYLVNYKEKDQEKVEIVEV